MPRRGGRAVLEEPPRPGDADGEPVLARPAQGDAAPDVAVASGRRRWEAVAAFTVAAAGAIVVVALGLAGSERTRPVGALLVGGIALVSGLALLARGTWGAERASFRRLLGAALVVWSAGQLLNGVDAISGIDSFPTVGDLVSLCATPLGIAGLALVPRRSAGTHPGWRLTLDSALLGVSITLLFWLAAFSGQLDRAVAPGDLVTVVILFADVVIVCVSALAVLRDGDRDLLLALAGVACYSVGDLMTIHATMETPGAWPWPGIALWCLAWPLIATGLLRYRPDAPDRTAAVRIDPEARGVAITTTLSLAVLVVSLAGLMLGAEPDRVALGLVLVSVAVFWARELLNARFRAELLRRLHAEATTDPLTGLANRRALAARMAALPDGEPWCLLTVDLDGFKDVNDLLGHATGDRLLAAVARRLAEAVPVGALVSRIGGDEFAVLLAGDPSTGAHVGEAIVIAVRRSAADVEGVARVEVSASVGVAAVHAGDPEPLTIVLPDAPALAPGVTRPGAPAELTPGGGIRIPAPAESSESTETSGTPATDPEEPAVVDPLGALSASGAALRVAKAAGRNRVEVYDAGVARIRQRRLRVEERLRVAVDSGDIRVDYQPIVDLRRGTLTGAEALARWTDPQLGPVDPSEFIPVAEQTGLVVALGERVLHETLAGGVEHGLFDRGLRISCNVSPVQLRVAGFHRVVQEALAAHGVDRERLVIEVTEQVVVEEGQAVQSLHRLAELGVTIAIDDFGTGYSALGYLQRLPAEVLKIDRSLTSSLVGEPRSRAITRAVLDMGRTVGLRVVVEGVETEEVADLVRRMGVGYAQGSYYGRAMPAAAVAAMADRMSATRS